MHQILDALGVYHILTAGAASGTDTDTSWWWWWRGYRPERSCCRDGHSVTTCGSLHAAVSVHEVGRMPGIFNGIKQSLLISRSRILNWETTSSPYVIGRKLLLLLLWLWLLMVLMKEMLLLLLLLLLLAMYAGSSRCCHRSRGVHEAGHAEADGDGGVVIAAAHRSDPDLALFGVGVQVGRGHWNGVAAIVSSIAIEGGHPAGEERSEALLLFFASEFDHLLKIQTLHCFHK